MNYRHYFLSLFLLLIFVSVASAADGPQVTGYDRGHVKVDKTFNYRTSLLDESWNPADRPRSKVLKIGYSVDLDYIFKWKISALMGEPVVLGQVVYLPTQIQIGDWGLYLKLNNQEALSKVRMTEFKMKVRMFLKPPGERAFDRGETVLIDAGSPGKPHTGHTANEMMKNGDLFDKFAGLNVPGSPDWNRLFTNIGDKQQAIKYFMDLDAAARKRDRYYASFYDHKVVKVSLDTGAVEALIRDHLKALEDKIKKEKKDAAQMQADELDAALAETESGVGGEDDLFSDESVAGEKSFEDMLEDTEKIKLTINDVPRTTSSNVITISGRVKNVSSIDSSEIVFKVNGLEQPVYLAGNGSFSNKVVLFNGENRININYSSAAKNEQKTVLVTSSTPPVKARFTLTWDSGGSDMDLHAYGPNDDHCSYGNKRTKNMQLDVDNTSGYGPENISVKLNQHPGTYKVYIKHFGGRAGNVTLYVYLDNRLIASEKKYLSGGQRWRAYDLEIE